MHFENRVPTAPELQHYVPYRRHRGFKRNLYVHLGPYFDFLILPKYFCRSKSTPILLFEISKYNPLKFIKSAALFAETAHHGT